MISRFVSEKEAFYSKVAETRGLKNVPTYEQREAIKKISKEHFDSLRLRVGSPLYISSLFRSYQVNKAVKGATNSDHLVLKDRNGHYIVAYDIDQDAKGKVGNRALFFIIMHQVDYHRLIWEFGTTRSPDWVHVSWSTDPKKNKLKKTFRATRVGSRTVYEFFNSSGLN